MKYLFPNLLGLALLAGCANVEAPRAAPAPTAPSGSAKSVPAAQQAVEPVASAKPSRSGPMPLDYPLEKLPFVVKSPAAIPALKLFPKPFATGTAAMESRVARKDGLYKDMVIPIHEQVYAASAPHLLHKSVQTSDLDGQPLYLREISLRWNGLLDLHTYVLKQDSSTISIESTLQALEITSNKWPKLEKGASFSYKATYTLRIPNVHRSKMQQTGTCTVVATPVDVQKIAGKSHGIECVSRYQDDPSEKRVLYVYQEDPGFLWQVQDVKDGITGSHQLLRSEMTAAGSR